MNKYRCQDCFRIFKSAEPKCPDCGSANVKEKKTRTQLPESESVSRPAVQPVQPELPAAEEPVQLPVLEPAPVKSGPEPVIPAEPVRPAKKPDPPRKKKKKRKPSKEEKRRKRIVAPKQKLQKPESSAIRPSELIPSAFKIDPVNLPDSPVDFNTFEDSKKEKKKV